VNWKVTALASAGVTALATWLTSTPPRQPPAAARRQASAASRAARAPDIIHEAERLRARVPAAAGYHAPTRNPFRFARVEESGGDRPASPPPVEDLPPAAIPQTPTLRVTLSGIAENTVAGDVVRTAVISTPDDVLLVKEGDSVAGQYRVTRITADSVELTRASDGVVVRLALQP
jgi:hypothetical protein